MSTEIQVVPATDASWNNLVQLVPHDVYHTREYNMTASLGVSESLNNSESDLAGSGAPRSLLFSYRREGMAFLFPYVLRTLEDVLGCEGRCYFDVTSVYGYGGPLASANASPEFLKAAWRELMANWRASGVISAFTRFHPLLQNVRFVEALAEEPTLFEGQKAILCGDTVSVDLSQPDAEQFQRYQKNLRNELRKAYSLGFEVSQVDFESSAACFVDLYTQTMKRRNASGEYLIDRDWLLRFGRSLKDHCCLLAAHLQGEVTAMLLVMEYGGFVHAHLTGIDDRFTSYSPLKPLLDGTRMWASARANRILHLGGGIGARHDSLFQFKRHFSPDTNPFHIGCWILNRKLYGELTASNEELPVEGLASPLDEPKPFPAYRFISQNQLEVVARRH